MMGTAQGGEWGCLRLTTIRIDQGNWPATMTASPVKTARTTAGMRRHTATPVSSLLHKLYAPTCRFVSETPPCDGLEAALSGADQLDGVRDSPRKTPESLSDKRLRHSAPALSCSEELADSSAFAAVVWALFSIWDIAWVICWIPADCSCEALAIWETSSSSFCECSRISTNPWATRVLLATPAMLLCRDLSIFSALSFAASAQRCASLRTSSATTANPSPASPALAASIAAFSANRLVWKAISSMVLTILPTSSLDVFTLAMAALMASTALTPSATEACVLPASSFARAACSSLPRVTSAIWARDVLTSPVDAELSSFVRRGCGSGVYFRNA